jgi:hypothetical protein
MDTLEYDSIITCTTDYWVGRKQRRFVMQLEDSPVMGEKEAETIPPRRGC